MRTVKFTGQIVSLRCEHCKWWVCHADTSEGEKLPRGRWHCMFCHRENFQARWMSRKEAEEDIKVTPEPDRDELAESKLAERFGRCCEKTTAYGLLARAS